MAGIEKLVVKGYEKALKSISPLISDRQKGMLPSHLYAHGHTLTMRETA